MKDYWADTTEAQRKVIAEWLGASIGQVLTYKLMRKLGAPKYVAYFACVALAQLNDIQNPIKPRLERAFKLTADDFAGK